jgi:hypothetical protein
MSSHSIFVNDCDAGDREAVCQRSFEGRCHNREQVKCASMLSADTLIATVAYLVLAR